MADKPMKIRETNVTHLGGDKHTVDLLIADDQSVDAANRLIQIVEPVDGSEYSRLAELQLAVLESAQIVLRDEIRRIKRAAGPIA